MSGRRAALRPGGQGLRGREPRSTDFSLEVRRGEFFALVGVNGAGKTTLIKCLLDFCDADRGAHRDLRRSAPRDRRARAARVPAGAVQSRRSSSPAGTSCATCSGSTASPTTKPGRSAMFAALDLDPAALARPARTYSKGMTQKLGLAACLLSGKELYVLDEPAGGLDPKARALLKRELRALREQRAARCSSPPMRSPTSPSCATAWRCCTAAGSASPARPRELSRAARRRGPGAGLSRLHRRPGRSRRAPSPQYKPLRDERLSAVQ